MPLLYLASPTSQASRDLQSSTRQQPTSHYQWPTAGARWTFDQWISAPWSPNGHSMDTVWLSNKQKAVYTYLHTHTYIHTCIHAYIHTIIHTYIYLYKFIYICKHIYIYIKKEIYIYQIMNIYIYICIHTHICIYSILRQTVLKWSSTSKAAVESFIWLLCGNFIFIVLSLSLAHPKQSQDFPNVMDEHAHLCGLSRFKSFYTPNIGVIINQKQTKERMQNSNKISIPNDQSFCF